MIKIRRSADRGHFNHGWLETFHTFSFGDYVDLKHRGYRVLRVLNEDWVMPGEGFPTHAHRDMEILTYVLQGALEHRDSMGNTSVIRAGDVQRMSAGTGVEHSEFNSSSSETVHLLQIWFFPAEKGTPPSYEQKTLAAHGISNPLRLIFSPDGQGDSISIGQNIFGYDYRLEPSKSVEFDMAPSRGVWIQVIEGRIELDGQALDSGDGAAVENTKQLKISASAPTHFLLFDLPEIPA